jgi:riboflavin kinase/FMN adenylyltransferase
VVNFNKEIANTNYEDFVKSYLVERINASHIVIGHDHKFGKGRSGDENKLLHLSKTLEFKLTVIPAVYSEGSEVSSTKIRSALTEGNLTEANVLLGRNYSLKGIVVEGVQRGREIGFPTANIEPLNKHKLIPAGGVYAVKCSIETRNYFGVLNIGKRPTFENQDKVYIELHIFNFEQDIYGKPVELEFIERIRDEKKFETIGSLVEQINFDITRAKQIFN